ncbi:hypothetical protein HDU93_009331, partial [Gonapodya sp. JEL0774]
MSSPESERPYLTHLRRLRILQLVLLIGVLICVGVGFHYVSTALPSELSYICNLASFTRTFCSSENLDDFRGSKIFLPSIIVAVVAVVVSLHIIAFDVIASYRKTIERFVSPSWAVAWQLEVVYD